MPRIACGRMWWNVTCARAARALRLYQAEKLNVAPRYAIGLM